MTSFIQDFLDALTFGSLYAMFALGIALIFGIMRLINFAHGELITAGGYVIIVLAGAPLPLVILATIAFVVILALAMERIALRPVRGANPETLLITSFAISFLLQNTALLIFGALPRSVTVSQTLLENFTIGSLTISKLDVVSIVVTFALLAVLGLFLNRTSLGVQMRAAAEDFQIARTLGVRANVVIALAFAISGLLAATGAVLYVSQVGTVSPTSGSAVLLSAFVATVLGGMGSIGGAVLGGYLIGIMTVALQVYLPFSLVAYRDAFLYIIVFAILIVRPQGLIPARAGAQRV